MITSFRSLKKPISHSPRLMVRYYYLDLLPILPASAANPYDVQNHVTPPFPENRPFRAVFSISGVDSFRVIPEIFPFFLPEFDSFLLAQMCCLKYNVCMFAFA